MFYLRPVKPPKFLLALNKGWPLSMRNTPLVFQSGIALGGSFIKTYIRTELFGSVHGPPLAVSVLVPDLTGLKSSPPSKAEGQVVGGDCHEVVRCCVGVSPDCCLGAGPRRNDESDGGDLICARKPSQRTRFEWEVQKGSLAKAAP